MMQPIILSVSLIILGFSLGLLTVALADWWNQKGDK